MLAQITTPESIADYGVTSLLLMLTAGILVVALAFSRRQQATYERARHLPLDESHDGSTATKLEPVEKKQ